MSGRVGAIAVTVLAPVGRLDLSLPAGVAVAEVAAELEGRLGIDHLALHTLLGEPLDPDASVEAQIRDGSVLQLVEKAPLRRPVVYDDVVEAMHDAHVLEGVGDARVGRFATLAASSVALGVGIVATFLLPASALAPVGAAAVAVVLLATAVWSSAATPDWATVLVWGAAGYAAAAAHLAGGPSLSASVPSAVALVSACAWVSFERGRAAVIPLGTLGFCGLPFALVEQSSIFDQSSFVEPVEAVLIAELLAAGFATILLPRLALGFARLHNGLNGTEMEAAIDRGRCALLVGVVSLGIILVTLVPWAMATGSADALLAIDVCLGFLLLARSLPRWEMVSVTLVLGSAALFIGVLMATALLESWRLPFAAAGFLGAGALWLVSVLPGRYGVRLTILADWTQWLTRLALLPLSVWAFGALHLAREWTPW